MKRTPAVLLAALCTALLLLPARQAQAQANAKPPTQLTYQGFLTDANGVPFGNPAPVNKTVYFRIYDALTGGAIKWSSQQVVTVDKGYFSALLGQGSAVGTEPFSADLTGVFTGSSTVSDRYLELTADGTTIAPRLRFLPAPYALLAKSATDLVDPVTGASSLSIASGNLNVGGALNVSSVNASGNISASGVSATSVSATGNISATGNVTAGGNVSGYSLFAASSITSHAQQGAYIEWNKDGGNGMSYILNQKGGGGGGGMVFGEVSTANTIAERMRIDGSGNVGIGTTAPASKLEVNGNVAATSFSGNGTIPLGGIIMWSGATTAVPAGWALCDGGTVNGRTTPNLKDRFVIGAGGGYAVGATGGNTSHSLTVGNLPSFSITYNDIYFSEGGGSVALIDSVTGASTRRGSGDSDGDNNGYQMVRTATFNGSATAFSIIPPYYALAFIMRVQ